MNFINDSDRYVTLKAWYSCEMAIELDVVLEETRSPREGQGSSEATRQVQITGEQLRERQTLQAVERQIPAHV